MSVHLLHRYTMSIIFQYRDQTWFSMHSHLLGPEGGVETRAWKGEGFNTSRSAQQMLMYQKSIFDRYYCQWNIFFAQKLKRNCFKNFFLPVPMMARRSMLHANVLKTLVPRQRLILTSPLLCNLLMMMSIFMTVPECLFVKLQSRALTACELPC